MTNLPLESRFKWVNTPPNNFTMEETDKMMETLQRKYAPKRMIVEMDKINDIGRYLVKIYIQIEK